MIDRNALRAQSDASAKREAVTSARAQFFKALDGLRLGYKQTTILRLFKDGGHYVEEGTTSIKLAGMAAEVWKMATPLSPELRPFSEWHGSRDSGHTVQGIDITFDWPDINKQEELRRRISEPGLKEICDAIITGIHYSGERAQAAISMMQTKCEARARGGFDSASVMTLQPLIDFSYPAGSNEYGTKVQPEWLGLAAMIVWKGLAKDNPTLEPVGAGRSSYYNIVVAW